VAANNQLGVKQAKIPFHPFDLTFAHGGLSSSKSLAHPADIKGALSLLVVALTVIKQKYDVVIWVQDDLQAIHHIFELDRHLATIPEALILNSD
jgi:hypothetical protein